MAQNPAADAPQVTNKVARCRNCGAQWQVKSFSGADTKACGFCRAGKKAITVESE
jgi:hypothetical protein